MFAKFKLKMIFIILIIISLTTLIYTACNKNEEHKISSLVIVSYGGGAWQESHKKAFFEPFSKMTGLNIDSIAWNAEYGKLKTDVKTGNVKWDVVEVTAAQFVRGKRENLFEKISLDLNKSDFAENTIDQYGVANIFWATVMAYKPNTFSGEQPKTWIDFWDIKRFPGPRALYDDPRGNLEFALLADGVPIKNLYPLDVDRAFKSLDRIKPHIRVWWNDASQAIQLLQSGQVVMSSAWNGRLFAARKDKIKIVWSWQGAAHDLDWWVIPKGAPGKKEAERFIWYALQPENLARQIDMVGYGPPNLATLKYVSKDIISQLPTNPENLAQGFVIDSNWWSDNESEIQRRWIEWKAR